MCEMCESVTEGANRKRPCFIHENDGKSASWPTVSKGMRDRLWVSDGVIDRGTKSTKYYVMHPILETYM